MQKKKVTMTNQTQINGTLVRISEVLYTEVSRLEEALKNSETNN